MLSSPQDSPLPPPAKRKSSIHPESPTNKQSEILWPEFHIEGQTFPTTFEAGAWKCPLCSKCTPRIKQHLASAIHKAHVGNWAVIEDYCNKIAVLRRKETKRKTDKKLADNPKRKESLRKADEKRADDPKRKESLRKADEQRADDPKRKESLRKAGKKADEQRADDPKRKDTLRKAGKKADEQRADIQSARSH